MQMCRMQPRGRVSSKGIVNVQPNVNDGLKLLYQTKENEEKKVVAVIVTLASGGTSDDLFTRVEQVSEEGTRVLVYACQANYLPNLLKMFEEEPEKEKDKELFENICSVEADCVLFNWECSSGYASCQFPEGAENLFKFVKIVLDRGHMAMFSDFSLKALIENWKEEYIGPNPFKRIGDTAQKYQLVFDNAVLQDCPSAQLQFVGEMAESGKVNVQGIGGTILYSVNQQRKPTDLYSLEILTVAHPFKVEEDLVCRIGEKQGAAGHVVLGYKSGGFLLTSMSHWVEVMKVDTSEQKLFEMAKEEYGEETYNKMQKQYSELNDGQKQMYRAKKAAEFIQTQAPCENQARKARRKG